MQYLKPWEINRSAVNYTSINDRLHQDILAFTSYIQPTPAETLVYNALFKALDNLIRQMTRPEDVLSIDYFGSRKVELGLPGGDLDIVVTTESPARNIRSSLFRLAAYLRTSGIVSSDTVRVNHHARVPVVTCRSVNTLGNISIDISFSNPHKEKISQAILVASAIQTHLKVQPALTPLVLVLKTFLKQRGLGNANRGGLGSYPLIVMVLSFLQLNPMNVPQRFITHPFDDNVLSLGRLLTDFFFYYGTQFPYEEKYISIEKTGVMDTDGNPSPAPADLSPSSVTSMNINRKTISLENGEIKEGVSEPVLPRESERGGLRLRAGVPWIKETQFKKISIQCLVEAENDIGKATSRMKEVIAAFQDAAAVLSQLESKNDDDQTVLGAIVGISEEIIAHRAHIERLVKERKVGTPLRLARRSKREYSPKERAKVEQPTKKRKSGQ